MSNYGESMKIEILKNCSYCDPGNPSAVARSFKKGMYMTIQNAHESLAMQMIENKDAIEAKEDESTDPSGENELGHLRARLVSLGESPDKRWGVDRLRKEINQAQNKVEIK